jgi:tetratricopeptide (TPR) repeat protein
LDFVNLTRVCGCIKTKINNDHSWGLVLRRDLYYIPEVAEILNMTYREMSRTVFGFRKKVNYDGNKEMKKFNVDSIDPADISNILTHMIYWSVQSIDNGLISLIDRHGYLTITLKQSIEYLNKSKLFYKLYIKYIDLQKVSDEHLMALAYYNFENYKNYEEAYRILTIGISLDNEHKSKYLEKIIEYTSDNKDYYLCNKWLNYTLESSEPVFSKAKIYSMMGYNHAGLGDYNTSMSLFDISLSNDPYNIYTYVDKSSALRLFKKYEDSIKCIRCAIRIFLMYEMSEENKCIILRKLYIKWCNDLQNLDRTCECTDILDLIRILTNKDTDKLDYCYSLIDAYDSSKNYVTVCQKIMDEVNTSSMSTKYIWVASQLHILNKNYKSAFDLIKAKDDTPSTMRIKLLYYISVGSFEIAHNEIMLDNFETSCVKLITIAIFYATARNPYYNIETAHEFYEVSKIGLIQDDINLYVDLEEKYLGALPKN